VLAALDGVPVPGARRLVGLVALERVPVREHTQLEDLSGKPIGEVTSGLLGPTIDKPVALAYVDSASAGPGTRLHALVRGKPVPMEVSKLPFVPHRYWRG
jgi:aminomethyltransferase